jgi:hypothetical protein
LRLAAQRAGHVWLAALGCHRRGPFRQSLRHSFLAACGVNVSPAQLHPVGRGETETDLREWQGRLTEPVAAASSPWRPKRLSRGSSKWEGADTPRSSCAELPHRPEEAWPRWRELDGLRPAHRSSCRPQTVLPGRWPSAVPGALRMQPAGFGGQGPPNPMPRPSPQPGMRSRPARGPVPQDRPADGRRQDRGPRLHRLSPGALVGGLVENPLGEEIRRRARVVGIFRTTPTSSGWLAPSWPTCTTNGTPANAVISSKPR